MDFDHFEDSGPVELYRANSGALKFQVKVLSLGGQASFALTPKDLSKKNSYLFHFRHQNNCKFFDFVGRSVESPGSLGFRIPEPLDMRFQEFWITWCHDTICLGASEQEPFFTYSSSGLSNNIGHIKFYRMTERWPAEWRFKASPVSIDQPPIEDIDDGGLRWVPVTGECPTDALIGGFEHEPLYIARAHHNRSLCPGKYIRSKHITYVSWGHLEHPKNNFEILCGYNAVWVKTKSNYIPQNAFIAGYSEVRREPLYIGRAMHDGHLLIGKVHTLYSTCYLPYNGVEVEVSEFEILVSPNHRGPARGIEQV